MYGLDFLGLGSRYWPIEMSIREFPAGWALGCFDTTFGNVLPHLRTFLKSGKVGAVRVQIWWSYKHTICPLSVLRDRAPHYEILAKLFPGVRFYISHSCEHNERDRAVVKRRVDLVKELAPSCTAVNTTWQGVKCRGAMEEKHGVMGSLKVPFLWSADGDDLIDADAAKFYRLHREADILFSWGALFNLNDGNQPADPKQRKAAPSAKYIQLMARLAQGKGKPPLAYPNAKAIVAPWLYKSCSQGTNDRREGKPCLIIKSASKCLEVLNASGKTLGQFIAQGGFEGGLTRFYAGAPGGINLWGHDIGKEASKGSGSEFIWFKGLEGYFGPVNPSYRQGYFRD